MRRVIAVAVCLAALTSVVSATANRKHPLGHQLTLEYTFERYIADFGKSYAPTEHVMRKKIFDANLRSIIKHNANTRRSYTQGVNHLTDLSEVELRRMRGARPARDYKPKSAVPYRRGILDEVRGKKSQTEIGSALPPAPNAAILDWRRAVPAVLSGIKDQGFCGGCWAHSVTESAESAYAVMTGQLFDLSQQQVSSCAGNFGACGGCGGSFPVVALDYFATNAVTLVEEYQIPFQSYNGTNTPCPDAAAMQLLPGIYEGVNITGYVAVGTNNAKDMETALNEFGPISILVDAGAWSPYEAGIFDGCGANVSLDHAVQAVGYGIDEWGSQYWIVRNSWSSGWGEAGYIRLHKSTDPTCGFDLGAAYRLDCESSANTGPFPSCGQCGILFEPLFPIVAAP